jgi:hypothetical protein
MHIPDLTPYSSHGSEDESRLISVGWLDPEHDFNTGEVGHELVRKLADLLVNPWQPAIVMGFHQCGFCRLSGGPTSFRIRNLASGPEVSMGLANLWLPANGFLYVAPSLILHYMDSHGYSPPAEFQEAVMACPPMRSIEYLKSILKNGPKGILPSAK